MTTPLAPSGSTITETSPRVSLTLTVYLVVLVLSIIGGVLAVLPECPSVSEGWVTMGCGDFRISVGNFGGSAVIGLVAIVIGIVASTVMRRRISMSAILVWASVGLLYLSIPLWAFYDLGDAFRMIGLALAVIGAVSGLWAGIGLCQTRTP